MKLHAHIYMKILVLNSKKKKKGFSLTHAHTAFVSAQPELMLVLTMESSAVSLQ